ncbi:protein kinase APK1B [Pyrus ussuriensis x Pyrus communis]|uniref:Protein kinase APK1B n=1 Tax=Pyrus ussuriensis x Pyrus communis TaxID=2448454 RepID=A0A5N5HAQ0_9ROSA|nr:protein kinase APK1B [Pyrus ussuriensis x Pyrus communis]
MDSAENIGVFTPADLKACANDFKTRTTRLDLLTRVTGTDEARDVKIWDEKSFVLPEEVEFLTHPTVNGHPNLVKLSGYCCEKEVEGVVYDLNPWDTLHNLTACLNVYTTRGKPYLVLDLNASHKMLDWECKLKLFEFGLIRGGIIGEMTTLKKQIPISIGFVDPFFAAKDPLIMFVYRASCDQFSSCTVYI